MVAHFQQTLVQNPIFDALYCEEEERFDEGLGAEVDFNEIHTDPFGSLSEHHFFWEDEEILTLLSKEKKQAHLSYDYINSDGHLKMVRNEAIKWMLKVIARYGFNAVTAVLAVNYYDRFVTSHCFQRDKPWMSQLAAVACLSVAAKVEETHVPVLLDLQVGESKYVFEAKTIQRMELLVLSTLDWKMNPVTPMSFIDHTARRFKLITSLHWDFFRRCESVIVAMISDCRLVDYLPSVIAVATMRYVITEIESCDAVEHDSELMSALRTSKEKIDDCHKLIVEVLGDNGSCGRKRKHELILSSPIGVIDAYISSDSSNDSWSIASSLETPLSKRKRSRAQEDQCMRLAPLSTYTV